MDNTAQSSPAVETQALTKSFGSHQVLRGLDLMVEAGDTLAIFGPNGAGKTTLIKTLASIIRPTSGRVLIDGLDMKEHAQKARARLGLLAHHSFLYGALSAEENLVFYGRMYSVADLKNRIGEMLSLVGLSSRRYDRVATFSRGMQQRLALARALLHNPSILLLDEPETGLDQQGLSAMWDIIRRDKTCRTIVFTSHNFERALSVCDQAAVLARGKIVFMEPSCKLTLDLLREAYESHTRARP